MTLVVFLLWGVILTESWVCDISFCVFVLLSRSVSWSQNPVIPLMFGLRLEPKSIPNCCFIWAGTYGSGRSPCLRFETHHTYIIIYITIYIHNSIYVYIYIYTHCIYRYPYFTIRVLVHYIYYTGSDKKPVKDLRPPFGPHALIHIFFQDLIMDEAHFMTRAGGWTAATECCSWCSCCF